MKRIYLFLLLSAAFATNEAFAQTRMIDLKVVGIMGTTTSNKTPVVSGQKILADAANHPDSKFYYGWNITNSGTDSLMPGDTIYIRPAYSQSSRLVYYFKAGTSLKSGKTLNNIYPVDNGNEKLISLVPGSGVTKSSVNSNYQWCDSVWVVKGPSNPAINENTSNNETCVTVTLTMWATGVEDVNKQSAALNIYPNPASGTMNLKYDLGFSANASVVIRDVTGKVVLNKNLRNNISGTQEHQLDISSLTAGHYFVELHADGKKIVSKVSVQ